MFFFFHLSVEKLGHMTLATTYNPSYNFHNISYNDNGVSVTHSHTAFVCGISMEKSQLFALGYANHKEPGNPAIIHPACCFSTE